MATIRVPREEARGLGLGDLIAAATKKAGIKPCDGCEKRRELLNRYEISRRGVRRRKNRAG